MNFFGSMIMPGSQFNVSMIYNNDDHKMAPPIINARPAAVGQAQIQVAKLDNLP